MRLDFLLSKRGGDELGFLDFSAIIWFGFGRFAKIDKDTAIRAIDSVSSRGGEGADVCLGVDCADGGADTPIEFETIDRRPKN